MRILFAYLILLYLSLIFLAAIYVFVLSASSLFILGKTTISSGSSTRTTFRFLALTFLYFLLIFLDAICAFLPGSNFANVSKVFMYSSLISAVSSVAGGAF